MLDRRASGRDVDRQAVGRDRARMEALTAQLSLHPHNRAPARSEASAELTGCEVVAVVEGMRVPDAGGVAAERNRIARTQRHRDAHRLDRCGPRYKRCAGGQMRRRTDAHFPCSSPRRTGSRCEQRCSNGGGVRRSCQDSTKHVFGTVAGLDKNPVISSESNTGGRCGDQFRSATRAVAAASQPASDGPR